jgi:hypothetical protein
LVSSRTARGEVTLAANAWHLVCVEADHDRE